MFCAMDGLLLLIGVNEPPYAWQNGVTTVVVGWLCAVICIPDPDKWDDDD